MKYTAPQRQTTVNVMSASPLKEFFVLTGGLPGLVVEIYLLLVFFIDTIIPHVSPGLERAMVKPLSGRWIQGRMILTFPDFLTRERNLIQPTVTG